MRFSILLLTLGVAACGASPETSTGATSSNAATGTGTTSGTGTAAGSGGNGGTTSTSQADLYNSGTRIRAVVATTPDGAKAFYGWHDTQLGVDCAAAFAADGTLRCLPALGVLVSSTTLFGDSGCTTPVAAVLCGSTTPAYAADLSGATTCGPGIKIRSVTGPHSGSLYNGSGGSCSPTNGPANYTFYDVGAEVDPSTFVAWTVSVE